MILDAEDYISGYNSALDTGAGIGRIAKQVLIGRFRNIDLLEPSSVQIEEARRLLANDVRLFIKTRLQTFEFTHKYDCIWMQWFLMYVNDQDLKTFLIKAKAHGLNRKANGNTGCIFIKDNISNKQTALYSSEDHSRTRTGQQFL